MYNNIKINRDSAKISYDTLLIEFGGTIEGDEVTLEMQKSVSSIVGNKLILNRKSGVAIDYEDERLIESVGDDELSITFKNFPDIPLYSSYIVSGWTNRPMTQSELANVQYKDAETTSVPMKYIHIGSDDEHYIRRDYSSYFISGKVYPEYTVDDNTLSTCHSNYVIWNSLFLYEVSSFTGNSVTLNDECENINDATLYFYDENGNIKYLNNCFVPFNSMISRMSYNDIYYFYDEDDLEQNTIAEYLLSYGGGKVFYYPDYRFYKIIDGTISLLDNTSFTIKRGGYSISLPLMENIGENLTQYDKYNNAYLEEKKQENINEIIDFEKQMFSPVYIDSTEYIPNDDNSNNIEDSLLKNIEEIEFRLHLRKRNFIKDEDTNEVIVGDYGDWDAEDGDYWNGYEISLDSNGNNTLLVKNNADNGDLLGYLGFTDDDVHYQKKRLKKSFLRLLFYDKPTMTSQTLRFYSTLFLDSGKLYTKYVKNISLGNTTDETPQVYDGSIAQDYRLSCNFNIYDKYNYSGCSEGFYLYLYPDLVDGNEIMPLYMKAEFNNAKYGKTIPLIMPINGLNEPLSPLDQGFPFSYMKEGENGNNTFDSASLVNDLFVKIYTKYNYEKQEFEWFLPRRKGESNGEDNKIIFDLYEPRINSITDETYTGITYLNIEDEGTINNDYYEEPDNTEDSGDSGSSSEETDEKDMSIFENRKLKVRFNITVITASTDTNIASEFGVSTNNKISNSPSFSNNVSRIASLEKQKGLNSFNFDAIYDTTPNIVYFSSILHSIHNNYEGYTVKYETQTGIDLTNYMNLVGIDGGNVTYDSTDVDNNDINNKFGIVVNEKICVRDSEDTNLLIVACRLSVKEASKVINLPQYIPLVTYNINIGTIFDDDESNIYKTTFDTNGDVLERPLMEAFDQNNTFIADTNGGQNTLTFVNSDINSDRSITLSLSKYNTNYELSSWYLTNNIDESDDIEFDGSNEYSLSLISIDENVSLSIIGNGINQTISLNNKNYSIYADYKHIYGANIIASPVGEGDVKITTYEDQEIEITSAITGTKVLVDAISNNENTSFYGWYDTYPYGNLLSENCKYSFNVSGITDNIVYPIFIHLVGLNYGIVTSDGTSGGTVNISLIKGDEDTGYHCNDNVEESKYVLKVFDGDIVQYTASPYEGYEFVGWYSNPECDENSLVSKEKNYILSIKDNGDSYILYAKFNSIVINLTYEII